MTRANYIRAPHFFNLQMACRPIVDAFGAHLYLVGSSIERRDYGDVDLRLILPDEEFDALFPGHRLDYIDPRWTVVCSAISLYLAQHSGLPIDFQIQRQTQANEKHQGQRQPMGLVQMRAGEAPAGPVPYVPGEMLLPGESVGVPPTHVRRAEWRA